MNQLIINKKFINNILKKIEPKNLDKFAFLSWVASINKNLKIDFNHFNKENQIKHFFVPNKNIIQDIPDFEIKTQSEFESFLLTNHGLQLEPLIDCLKEANIDYWQELLNLLVRNQKEIKKFNYSVILTHIVKDDNFETKNKEKIIEIIDSILKEIENDNIKYYSDILEFLSFTIDKQDKYLNDWIVESLDVLIKKSYSNPTKQFTYILDKIKNQFNDLSFENKSISKEFKRVLKGNLAIVKKDNDDCFSFFLEINMQKLFQSEKLVEQIVFNNLVVGLTELNRFLKENSNVLSSVLSVEKRIVSLAVIHEEDGLNEKINDIFSEMLDKTRNNEILEKSQIEKRILFMTLKKNLVVSSETKQKIIKI